MERTITKKKSFFFLVARFLSFETINHAEEMYFLELSPKTMLFTRNPNIFVAFWSESVFF